MNCLRNCSLERRVALPPKMYLCGDWLSGLRMTNLNVVPVCLEVRRELQQKKSLV